MPGGSGGVIDPPTGNSPGEEVEGGSGGAEETDKSEESDKSEETDESQEKDEEEEEDIMENGTCKDEDKCSLGPISFSVDGTTFDTYYCWNPTENVDLLRLLSGQRKDCRRDDYEDEDDDYMGRAGGRGRRGRRFRRRRYWRRW